MIEHQRALRILQDAELIYPAETVQAAVQQVARAVCAELDGAFPLVLSVMGGAVVFTGQLLPQLNFPLDFDYVHVSRYADAKRGGALRWKVEPSESVRGRTVLVLDDILDEGETLAAVKQRLLDLGAEKVYCAVLADKLHGRAKPLRADFVGLEVPDRFVFGCGMDIHGAWRNLPAIYAVKEG